MNLVAFAPPDWLLLADCQYTDPEVFFPEPGGSVREAKRVCGGCEVRAQCLEYALAGNEKFGVWGGLSERERHAVLVARDKAAGIVWCKPRRHVKDERNTASNGECLACRSDRAERSLKGLAA